MGRLVLSRRIKESVVISNNNDEILLVISVNKIPKRDTVSLTFEADENIQIDRSEIYEKRIRDKPVWDRWTSIFSSNKPK